MEDVGVQVEEERTKVEPEARAPDPASIWNSCRKKLQPFCNQIGRELAKTKGRLGLRKPSAASRFRNNAWRRNGYRPPDGRSDHLGLLLTLSAARAASATRS
jgi:hypothetical protein